MHVYLFHVAHDLSIPFGDVPGSFVFNSGFIHFVLQPSNFLKNMDVKSKICKCINTCNTTPDIVRYARCLASKMTSDLIIYM